MNYFTRTHSIPKTTSFVLLLIFSIIGVAQSQDYQASSGFIPLSEQEFEARRIPEKLLRDLPSYYLCSESQLTPPEHQYECGSCWAFATMGMVESRIKEEYGVQLDLSEQFVVSCDMDQGGCCCGSVTTLDFLQEYGLILADGFSYNDGDALGSRDCGESCGGYTEIDIVDCPNPYPARTNYQVSSWGTVGPSPDAIKSELITKGPVVISYRTGSREVGSDFNDYWHGNLSSPEFLALYPDSAYIYNGAEEDPGRHAVLLIGYNDVGEYWILQNSWGLSGPFSGVVLPPNQDMTGTFRIAYDAGCDFAGATTCNVNRTNSEQLKVYAQQDGLRKYDTFQVNNHTFKIAGIDESNQMISVDGPDGYDEPIYKDNCETWSDYGAAVVLDYIDDNFTPLQCSVKKLVYTSAGPNFSNTYAEGRPGGKAVYVAHAPSGYTMQDRESRYEIAGMGTLTEPPLNWDVEVELYDGDTWAEIRIIIPAGAGPLNDTIYLISELEDQDIEYYTKVDLVVCDAPGAPTALLFDPLGPHYVGQPVTLSWAPGAATTSFQVLLDGGDVGPSTADSFQSLTIAEGTYIVRAINNCSTTNSAGLAPTIVPRPVVEVTSPASGENWEIGTSHAVNWVTTGDVPEVDVLYSIDAGSSWVPIATDIANVNSLNWTVPDVPTTQGKIRVRSSFDHGVYGDNSGYFIIEAPGHITVTSPNGGEIWTEGQEQQISWTSVDCGSTVGIYLLQEDVPCQTISSSAPNIGSFNYSVNRCSAETGSYRIQIKDLESGISDNSDGEFEIQPFGPGSFCDTSPFILNTNRIGFSQSQPTSLTNTPDQPETPLRTALGSPYPNPFNPMITIPFSIRKPGKIEVNIYDLRGRRVTQLVHGDFEAGWYEHQWNGKNGKGSVVAAGIYLVRIKSAEAKDIKKITLLK